MHACMHTICASNTVLKRAAAAAARVNSTRELLEIRIGRALQTLKTQQNVASSMKRGAGTYLRISGWQCLKVPWCLPPRPDTGPTAWGLDVQVWNLLWTGEGAMKKGMSISKKAGFECVEDLPRTAIGFSSYQELQPQWRHIKPNPKNHIPLVSVRALVFKPT